MKTYLIAALSAALLSACATNPYTGEHARTATGATIGAGAGALLGGMVSSRSDRTKGALIGAAVGATVGGLIGRQMDQQEAELRRSMSGSGVDITREGDTIRLQAPENITFDTNRADIKPQFKPVLNQLAQSIRQYPGTVVQVEGHTDSTGSAAYNQTLSENRAASVRSHLIQQGVEANRVLAVGYGMSRPIADNRSAAGRAQNRRVEILIVPQQQ
ncbi:OmpA family protein [Pseudothauera hydrothermalis]|uniref:OmpA family protein n=1 Tax=Pseudothauera hydrothermalis TaxID=2184083 RepID=UPI000C7D0047|nr:OmpA family protein [Pseudothauera hydrothermalis]AUL99367.1 cell envelope biogenesis protein OmpA [Rhodocyclaceae bacterium]